MEKKKCYVLGCTTVGGQLYRIPVNKERAEKWRAFCQNPVLDKYYFKDLHNSFQVCSKHFSEDAFTYPSSGKLLRSAVPVLFPPGTSPPPVDSSRTSSTDTVSPVDSSRTSSTQIAM